MKYKSSAYTEFIQRAKNQHDDHFGNKQQEAFPRDISFWDDISSQKSEITLLNSNIEEESHFSFLQNPQQYKFLKTYTTSLLQQFYDSSLTSFISKRKEANQSKDRKSSKYSESNESRTSDFSQNPLYQVLSYWANSIKNMTETKKGSNKSVVDNEVPFAKMFSKDKISEKKGFIANVIDTIYEDKYVSIYRIKGTSMYCVNAKGSYIWNCTYNSNYDQRKTVHIKKKGFTYGRVEDISIYDRKIESAGICAFDLSVGNLGILLHHAMFYFSPETSTVQIFHLDLQLPEITILSSDKKRIIACVGTDIIGEKVRNSNDASVLTLGEEILPDFFQTEYDLRGVGLLDIDLEGKNIDKIEIPHEKKTIGGTPLHMMHQNSKSLTFWGDILRHIPHKVSYSMFEPPPPNRYVNTFTNWRNQLSPSSIAGLGLLLCEELQKWMIQIKHVDNIDDLMCVLEERDRLASLAFCMRKELWRVLSVFTKGDRIVQKQINDLIYTKMKRAEINNLIKQNKRLYNVRLVEPDSYWGVQKKNPLASDME